jgi:hypothetical protein
MKFAHIAFCKRVNADIVKRGLFEKRSDMLEIAREPIQAFCDNEVDLARFHSDKKCLIPGPVRRGAGDRMIGKCAGYVPTFTVNPCLTYAHLVRDRRIPLVLRAVASIDRRPHACIAVHLDFTEVLLMR